ncbi:hypothetical protein Ahy_A01g000916 isoform C [Arachis hypogaea]|uniref:Uncharacterized protein n=1 Tax=Arachis hypogaea TaxID=3818 RepID=A0A445ELI6_ARAHY|nr:hypothetical protein Ahy_A01g000916 isoform C [Arachis hypogaea]
MQEGIERRNYQQQLDLLRDNSLCSYLSIMRLCI